MLRRPRTALLGALACLAGLAFTGMVTYLVPAAQVHDSASLSGFAGFDRPRISPWLDHIAHLADPDTYALLGGAVVLLALARHRWRMAIAIGLLLFLAPATTELLKPLVASPRPNEWLGGYRINAASWPSGHSTAAMTIALASVMAAPAVARPFAAVGGGLFAVSVSFSLLALQWHFPSDVIGGYLVAGGWTLLAVAALRRWPQPDTGAPTGRPERPGAVLALAGLLALAGVAAGLALAVDRPRALAGYLADRPSFVFAVAAISALAAVLAGVLAYTARN